MNSLSLYIVINIDENPRAGMVPEEILVSRRR